MDNTDPSVSSRPSKSGSQKFIIPLLLISLIIILGAGAYMIMAKKDAQQKAQTQGVVAQNAPSPTSGTVISSIKEALAGSQSLQCDFTDDAGRKIVSYVKSGMIRSDITASDPKESTSMIMKENTMYFWNGSQGTKMSFDLSQIEKITPPSRAASDSEQKPEDFVATMEKYKESCRPATVSDAHFTAPSDVKFTDLSSLMQGAKPNTSGVPAMTEEQMKALQEQFQQ